jgi:hypothetical protein
LLGSPFKYFVALEGDADVEVVENADADADMEVLDEN